MIERHRHKCVSGMRFDLGNRCSLNGLHQSCVFGFRYGKRFPSGAGTHPAACLSLQKNLIGDMERRENPTSIEVRNVINKCEQATRLHLAFPASEYIGVLVTLVADLLEASLHSVDYAADFLLMYTSCRSLTQLAARPLEALPNAP